MNRKISLGRWLGYSPEELLHPAIIPQEGDYVLDLRADVRDMHIYCDNEWHLVYETTSTIVTHVTESK